MLDKGRAFLNKKQGAYNFDCPLDNYFLSFVGVKGADILELLKQGKGDGEVLAWVQANAPLQRRPEEVVAWSHYHENRPPMDVEMRAYFNELHQSVGASRKDIGGWFDLLDLDDHVSFGGQS
jgi:hypothetical protein